LDHVLWFVSDLICSCRNTLSNAFLTTWNRVFENHQGTKTGVFFTQRNNFQKIRSP
jgi:hypothetical protein